MKFFDKYKDIIETYSDDTKIKPFEECKVTNEILKNEAAVANPYLLLAYKFLWYGQGGSDETGDYYFYKY